MKTKKLSKKLTVKKETISNLGISELEDAKGGLVTRNYSECGDGYATLVPCLCVDTELCF